jgi:hypothetical protein
MVGDKKYSIEMEKRGDYLWVLTSGEKLTAEISAAYWDEIATRCIENGIDKILIEKDFPKSVEPVDMIQMAEHLGKLLPHRKVAFYDRHGHESINELGKKLARNREVMMQVFSSTADAERWLAAN